MDEAALHSRLETIARRQSYLLALLVGGYLLAGSWLLVDSVAAVTVWTVGFAVVVLVVLGSMLGIYRRRRSSA